MDSTKENNKEKKGEERNLIQNGGAHCNKMNNGVGGWFGGIEFKKLKGGGRGREGGKEDKEEEKRERGGGGYHDCWILGNPQHTEKKTTRHDKKPKER